MRRNSLNRWLPSKTVLDAVTEQQFCTQIAERTRRSTTRILSLALAVLLIFVLMDVINGGQWYSRSNWLRYASMLCVFTMLLIGNHQNIRLWCRTVYLGSVWMMGMITALFVEIGLSGGKLYEGGPMVAVMMSAAIPALHFGHKLVIWTILALGLVLLNQISNVDTEWTLFYFAMTVVIMAFKQYQIDRLMRLQFRAELLEKVKAETDQLTGVLNRHAFTRMTDKILHDLRHDEGLALAIIDLDYFKRYNDHYGHLQGDQALVAVGQRLASLPTDLVVRFGGEEFILVVRFTRVMPDWLATLHQTLRFEHQPHATSPFGHLTCSVGVAVLKSNSAHAPEITPKYLLETADKALYEVKASGRDNTQLLTICVVKPTRPSEPVGANRDKTNDPNREPTRLGSQHS